MTTEGLGYCINAVRALFRSEPLEVVALRANGGDARFEEVDEMTSAVLRFPGERLASSPSGIRQPGPRRKSRVPRSASPSSFARGRRPAEDGARLQFANTVERTRIVERARI